MIRHYLATLFCILISKGSVGQVPFEVRIDPRFEAISLFYTLATADSLDTKPTPSKYYKEAKDYFADCKFNTSLEWYRKLDRWDGFDIASFGIYLSPHYPFHIVKKVEINYIKSAPVDTFLYHLNQFYKDCSADVFISKHQKDYRRIIQHTKDTINRSNILSDVANFFGHAQSGEFVIYLDVLNNLGSNAIPLSNPQFKGKRLNRIAYLSDSTTHPSDQDPVTFNPYLNVVAHECTHTFVGDLIPLNEARLYKIRELFLQTTKGAVIPADQWKNELEELVVRVCVAKILERRDGRVAGQAEIKNQARHFKLAEPMYNFFDTYTLHRDRYKTFKQFYPVLVAYLEKQALKY